jgi:hypothetical protein
VASKHTPGPWNVETANKYGEIRITASATKKHTYLIALTSPDCPDSQTQEANTSLMAAAPDLLAALESLLPAYDDARAAGHGEILIAQARAAIAKAKGEA